jgi:hypothetical protein
MATIVLSMTYETVSHESAEHGEAAERGFCSGLIRDLQIPLETTYFAVLHGEKLIKTAPSWQEAVKAAAALRREGKAAQAKKIAAGHPAWAEAVETDTICEDREEALEFIKEFMRYGGDWSTGRPQEGSYFTLAPEEDYRTGEQTSYSLHIEGLSPEEWASLATK